MRQWQRGFWPPAASRVFAASAAGWVGSERQLIMKVTVRAKPAIFDPAIAERRRINFLWMHMNEGFLPPGIQNLTTQKLFQVAGNGTNSAERPLPGGFWSMKTCICRLRATR